MTERTTYLSTDDISPNPENPRLIFYESELKSLEESIRDQGILVPLTVYRDDHRHVILDGERRWKCAKRLGIPKVPVIIQPKPNQLQNIMMMFAIHKSRRDWPPLSTAIKLKELEDILTERAGKRPSVSVLAENASIKPGEVRRLRKILKLPDEMLRELRAEQEKEPSEQTLRVDQAVEAADGVSALRKTKVVSEDEERELRKVIIEKFRKGNITSTVEPRRLARIASAVKRGELDRAAAGRVVRKVIENPSYSIEQAYQDSTASVDAERGLMQVARRLLGQLDEQEASGGALTPDLKALLGELRAKLERLRV